MKKRALIIGAGIAGPVLASSLLDSGFEPTVYEAYPAGAALGAGSWLSVAVNGIAALRLLGLDREVLQAAFPSKEIELVNDKGRVLGVASLGGTLPDGTMTQTIRRADLYRVLANQAQQRAVRFEHGKRLASAETRPDGTVVARFVDGSEVAADVLVGADGVHSTVRSIIDPRAPLPRATGMGNVGGFAPGAGVALPKDSYRMMFGKRAFFGWVTHPSGDVWWFANPPFPFPSAPDKEWLAALFDEDEGPAARLIRATPGDLVFSAQHELPRVPRWHCDAMIILGDAAHAASPTSGQGASLAIEDAVALGRCLRDLPIPAALAAFESTRRRRVERVVAEAARMSSQKIPGAFGRFARDLVLPYFLSRAVKSSREWLFSYEIPWQERARVGEPAAAA